MLEYPSISKRKPEFPEYLNFQTLRDIGIKHLQALSGKLWTDYNLHDPGVTILEVLCYAVTDLGYRNNLDIADLLALNPTDSQQKENNFFTPDEILTCNPVTVLDVRKRLIDISGVRNAWLEKVTEKVTTYHPPIYIDYVNSKLLQHPPNDQTSENAPCLHPRGLYTVYIDLDLASRKNACGQISRSWSDILDEVKAVLCSYRNLCEDVYDIVVLGEEEIGLCSDIELEADADAEDVLVDIYVKLQSSLSPRLTFYTLQELLDKGKSTSEIFAGRPSVLHSRKIQPQLVKRESKVNQESKIYYKYNLISQHKSSLLEGLIDYDNEVKASTAFDELLTFSRNLSNYRLIDNAEGVHSYSFALYQDIDLLASHPQRYATPIERDKALHSLIDAVNTDGDYKSHGFIDTDELAALTQPTVIYTSDLYQEILKIPGVAAIRKLSIANYINGLAQSQSSWHLQLTKGYSPALGIEQSKITLFKGLLPIPAEANEVKRRYYEQQAAHIKVIRKDNDLDLSIPQGSYYDLADHYSIQHDFPLTYGISEDGLPESAELLRKAQARQLKGYLVFFDQLLANYLAQLAHVRDLFSWEVDELQTRQNVQVNRQPEKWHTYFTQLLDFPQFEQIMDFPGLEQILKNPELDINNPKSEEIVPALGKYREFLNSINEEPETYSDRRNRFLDHLLGRFAESFADYVLLNYRMVEGHQDKVKDEIKIIQDKAQFLQDYPTLSRDRFRAFNYYNYQQVWNTENVSGFQKRVSRLLGFEDVRRRNLCHYQVDKEPGKFIFTCNVGEQSLTSKQTYLSRKDAQADLEKFLLFALHRNFYKGLTYSYFYHYGWEVEVVDDDNTIIARYEPYFLSQGERIAALNFLSEKLSSLFDVTEQDDGEASIATSSIFQGKSIIQIKQIAEENLYYFQLDIPSETGELIKFQGIQRYFSEALAQKAAIAILKQIANKQNYRPILFRQDNNSAERETAIPSSETRFTHYGYALIDQQGKVLAASSDTPTLREANATESFHDRFPSQTKRDIELQRWFSNIQLNHNQFQFTVEKVNESYLFTVKHNTENQILLQSCQSQTTELLAWQSAANFAENLRYLNRYVSQVKDQAGNSYSLGIVDQSGTLQAIAPTETNAFTTFKLLNSLEPFLQIERVIGESTGYRFRLVDLDGAILLQSTQLFSNRSIARDRFYQDVLGVLFEPGGIEPTTTQESFGFRVLSKPRDQQSAAATSPQLYSSESERDAAIEHLFLFVRTARLINIIPEPGSIPFWLIYFLKLTLQLRVDNFTQYALIKLGNSPDPTYILELASSPDPTYIGRIYDQNHNILLEGTQHHPTPEAAWKQGDICMELVAVTDTQNFRLIDAELGNSGDDSQPNQNPTEVYGWELTNRGKDEILATHYYNSQEERNQSIQTLQKLVNDEGFHLLEHILLRPQTASDNFLPICVNGDDATNKMGEATPLTYQDPYSFWITVILPYWSERFRNIDFRRFVERTLRLEAPAHIALKIAWVNVQQMHEFEVAYHDWLEQLALNASNGSACNLTGTLNRLLTIIPQLRSVYPQGILYDPQVVSKDQPIILNQTALGTAND